MSGTVEHLALFGQDEAAGMAVEQRYIEILLERADLAAHRRLRQAELMTGMGEAAGFRHRMENPELVPVHRHDCYSRMFSMAERIVSRIVIPRPRGRIPGQRAISRLRVPPCSPCRRPSPPGDRHRR